MDEWDREILTNSGWVEAGSSSSEWVRKQEDEAEWEDDFSPPESWNPEIPAENTTSRIIPII